LFDLLGLRVCRAIEGYFTFLAPSTVWIDDVKIWKVK